MYRMEPGIYSCFGLLQCLSDVRAVLTVARLYAFLGVGALVMKPKNVAKHLGPGLVCMKLLLPKNVFRQIATIVSKVIATIGLLS